MPWQEGFLHEILPWYINGKKMSINDDYGNGPHVPKQRPLKKAVEPITPDEAAKARKDNVHPGIIKAVNELLTERYNGKNTVTFTVEDLITKFYADNSSEDSVLPTRDDLFNRGHLDIEDIYSKYGWTVECVAPDRDQSFKTYFKFRNSASLGRGGMMYG